MFHFHFFLLLVVLTLNIGLFNACSGVAAKRDEILRSLKSDLVTAPPPPTTEEAEEFLNDNVETEQPSEPDDPEKFNYFPYDLQLDTIAYMSCENPTFFTFKAGAYFSRSGLRLSEYFLQQMSSMSAHSLKALIESSTKYQVTPWFGYAHSNNFLQVRKPVQIPLRLWRLVDDLITTGTTRIRSGADRVEAQISYGPNAGYAVEGLNNSGFKLILYYKDTENKVPHKPDGDVGVDIYGRIYTLQLDEIVSASLLSRHALRSISEEKRPEAPPQKTWICPESLRFEIRRHATHAFNPQTLYDSLSGNYKQKYPTLDSALNAEEERERISPSEELCPTASSTGTAASVARSVLGSKWNINTDRKCISLKSPSDFCYTMTSQRHPAHRLADTDAECTANGNNYCPHFLSICVRRN